MELEEIIKLTEILDTQNELIQKLTLENGELRDFVKALLEG